MRPRPDVVRYEAAMAKPWLPDRTDATWFRGITFGTSKHSCRRGYRLSPSRGALSALARQRGVLVRSSSARRLARVAGHRPQQPGSRLVFCTVRGFFKTRHRVPLLTPRYTNTPRDGASPLGKHVGPRLWFRAGESRDCTPPVPPPKPWVDGLRLHMPNPTHST